MDKAGAEILQDQINALVDGQLPRREHVKAMDRLAGDPVALETLWAWQAQREALRGLHAPLLAEPVPENLLAAARRRHAGRLHIMPWWRWGGMAAAMVLAFGMGWLMHGQQDGLGVLPGAFSQNRMANAFMRQASVAHAVFSPEVRHPVEVTAAQQEHLVQWLSKRLGKPLKIPVLAALGYELVGGRLLPGDGGARAQFMFQNAAGMRVTLYLGALDADALTHAPAAPATEAGTTAFRYSAEGAVASFYWVDQGFGYALSGEMAREELMRLAQLVYQQL